MDDTPRKGNPKLQVRMRPYELEYFTAAARAAGYPSLSAATRAALAEKFAPRGVAVVPPPPARDQPKPKNGRRRRRS